MDEIKDIDKNKIAHPNRPLSRGLISKKEAELFIDTLIMGLFAYSMVVWVILNEVAALTYLLVVVYLWMIYCGFGIEKWLSGRPFLYALSRQMVVFPVVFFAVAAASPATVLRPATWSFGCLLLGASFTYEICRKLDPHSHPVLATYIHYYGFRRTFEFAVIMVALSAMGAFALHVTPLLVPCELIVVGAMATLFFQPALFRIAEVTATVSLLLHGWAVALFHLF